MQYSSHTPFIGGPDGQTWNIVLQVLNATYTTFPITKVMEPVEILDNGTVDFSVDLTEMTGHRNATLYPLLVRFFTVIVPKASPYPASEAIFLILTADSIAYVLVTSALAVIMVLAISRYVVCGRLLIFECVVDVVKLLTNYNYGIKYAMLSRSEASLIVPLTFAGFIISNVFLSNLKSHLTRPIIRHQIETVEEVYHSSFPYLTYNEYFIKRESELLEKILPRGDWHKRMNLANSSEITRLVNEDAGITFCDYQHIIKFIASRRKYHVSKVNLQLMWFSYNARYDFPFMERVNEIIQWIKVSGLYDKWRHHFAVLHRAQYKIDFTEKAIETVSVPVFIVYGYIVGGILLILEILCKKYQLMEILEKKTQTFPHCHRKR